IAFLLQRLDRGGAVEDVDLRPAGPALIENLDGDLGRVGPYVTDLDAVFLLERGRDRTHELAHDLRRVPDYLALLPRGLDQRGIGGAGLLARKQRRNEDGRRKS